MSSVRPLRDRTTGDDLGIMNRRTAEELLILNGKIADELITQISILLPKFKQIKD